MVTRHRSSSIADRVLVFMLAAGSLILGIVAVRALSLGVPIRDPWLFPMMVALPALLSIGLALTLFASTTLRANIVMLGTAILVGLYAVEAALEVLPDPNTVPPPVMSADGGLTDTRSRLEVVADLRAEGTEAYPSFGARGMRATGARGPGIVLEGRPIAPLAQLRNAIIVDCNESGQFSVFRSDERGYNNPSGSWQRPIEVAAVGDSYVQGSCVDASDNLVAGIRLGIPGTVGLGLADTGPLVMLGMIKEYLSDVEPAEVFWFFYEGNDLRNLGVELGVPELRQYLEPGRTQGLASLQDEIDRSLIRYMDALLARPAESQNQPAGPAALRTKVRRWARLHRLRNTLGLVDIGGRLQRCCDLDALEAVLLEADRTVRGWGGRLHFVYLPAAGRYAHPFSAWLDDDLRARGRVLRTVRRTGLPMIDIHDVFRATGAPENLTFSGQSHFNPAGYRVTAEAVLRYLEEQ